MPTLDELEKEMEQLSKKASKAAGEAVFSAIKKILDEFPEVAEVSWFQYVPGYNDGDPCVFGIGDVNFKPTFTNELDGWKELGIEKWKTNDDDPEPTFEEYQQYLEEDGEEAFQEMRYALDDKNEKAKKLDAMLDSLYKILTKRAVEGWAEETYGENALIRVTRDGVESEDYDCGY